MAHSVEALHPSYGKHHKLCEMINDAIEGEWAVKDKGSKYLPMPSMFAKTAGADGAKKRYAEYLARACFIGISGETLSKLVGLAFQKVPDLKLPDFLSHLEKNADGQGMTIYQLSQKATRNILKHYRVGFYVDYPSAPVGKTLSVAEQKALKLAPRIHCIDSKNITQWGFSMINNERRLSLLVIKEDLGDIGSDGFLTKPKSQWRVLRLQDGVYTVQVFSKNEKNEIIEGKLVTPKDANGNVWTEIPFTFCNATDLSDELHAPPMTEIVNLNFSHYRNSADEEESAFICGQPIITYPELTHKQADGMKKSGVDEKGAQSGSRAAVATKVEIVQASANTLVGAVADKKIAMMQSLGASMIEVGSANKTATEAENDSSIQHSVLSLVVSNISEALQLCLGWAAKFAVADHEKLTPSEMFFAISQDFNKVKFSNEKAKRLWDACVMGVVPFKVWFEYEQSGKFTEMTWDEVEALLEEQQAKMPTAGAGYIPKTEEDEIE